MDYEETVTKLNNVLESFLDPTFGREVDYLMCEFKFKELLAMFLILQLHDTRVVNMVDKLRDSAMFGFLMGSYAFINRTPIPEPFLKEDRKCQKKKS